MTLEQWYNFQVFLSDKKIIGIFFFFLCFFSVSKVKYIHSGNNCGKIRDFAQVLVVLRRVLYSGTAQLNQGTNFNQRTFVKCTTEVRNVRTEE